MYYPGYNFYNNNLIRVTGIDGAQEYAEAYVYNKSKGKGGKASRYKEMSLDELKHAAYIHDEAVMEISSLENTIKAPEDMREKWRASHSVYVERSALIKQMLSM